MALLNMAFSYSQLGNGMKSKEIYEKVIEDYPQNEIARSALRMLNSMNNNSVQCANEITT